MLGIGIGRRDELQGQSTLHHRESVPQKAQYACQTQVYLKISYVNPDHVHMLVDVPTRLSIEDLMQLFKRQFPLKLRQ